nr:MAG TPA: C2H2 type zinc-finger protein [Caudoviricetes sp.]
MWASVTILAYFKNCFHHCAICSQTFKNRVF